MSSMPASAPRIFALHGFMGHPDDFSHLAFPRPIRPLDWLKNEPSLDDVLASLKETLRPNDYLLGYSMGGRVALHFAARYPDHLAGLILVGASPGIRKPEDRTARLVKEASWIQSLQSQPYETFLENWYAQPLMQTQRAAPNFEALYQRRLQNDTANIIHSLQTFGSGTLPSLWDKLPQIACPTLLVTGENDSCYQAIAQRMLPDLPNAQHLSIPNAGHAPQNEAPELFTQVLGNAIDKTLQES